MLADERMERILQIVNHQEFAEVEELASRLEVSTMTIRRDLQKLSESGLIQRRHGGATTLSAIRGEEDYDSKKGMNLGRKKQIATKALGCINDGDIIYLDGGTTTFELSALLVQRSGLTVITNDLAIAGELSKKDVALILVGGQIQKSTQTVTGLPAVEFLRQFRVASSFIGATSVSKSFDVLSPTAEKAFLKKTAMEIAEQSFLLVDDSKFYGYSLNKFGSLSDFSGVVTDREFSEKEQHRLNTLDIHIIPA